MIAPTTPARGSRTRRKPRAGLSPPCPLCGSRDGVGLNLDEPAILHCHGCKRDFTPADVGRLIAEWRRVLAWLELAPAPEE